MWTQLRTPHQTPRTLYLIAVLAALVPLTAVSAQEVTSDVSQGADISGAVTDRDTTRVFGTIYDSSGTPQSRVDIRVFNDQAPANEVRTRSRKTGSYVARNFGRLYTERDLYGLKVRVRFEAAGFKPSEIVSAVEKNNGLELNPILWREGEQPAMDGWCLVLTGQLTNAKGKKVKDGAVRITSPDDPALDVEAEVDKGGNYRAMIWNGPGKLQLEATGNGATETLPLSLDGQPRYDLVAQIVQDVTLGG